MTTVDLPADQNSGWAHLLPPLKPGHKLLCVDCGPRRSAPSLDYWFDDVTAHRVNVPMSATLPFETGEFDAVACRMIDADLDNAGLGQVLAECARVLAAAGWLYVDGGADSWLGRIRYRERLASHLARLGLTWQRSWPLLIERGAIAEILPAQGYCSCRNAWRVAERLKEWTYGPAARWLAPGHAFVASRKELPASALDALAADAGAGHFARLLINPAKSFFQPSSSATRDIPLIYVLPGDARTVDRRRTEFATIARLRAAGLGIEQLLPRIYRECQYLGRPAFAIEAFDGVTIDLPVAGLDDLYEMAHNVLLRFNRLTCRRIVFDDDGFDRVAGHAGHAAISMYGAAADTLGALLGALSARLRGKSRTVVGIHGDYKLENLVFDRRSRNVQAVIDWELANDTGLPLVDMLYLTGYREITLCRIDDILALLERGRPEEWSSLAKRLFAEYVREFGLTVSDRDEALAAFFLHHIGTRYAYNPQDPVAMNRINRLASRLNACLTDRSRGLEQWS